jgi:hypothetical protein
MLAEIGRRRFKRLGAINGHSGVQMANSALSLSPFISMRLRETTLQHGRRTQLHTRWESLVMPTVCFFRAVYSQTLCVGTVGGSLYERGASLGGMRKGGFTLSALNL